MLLEEIDLYLNEIDKQDNKSDNFTEDDLDIVMIKHANKKNSKYDELIKTLKEGGLL